MQNWMKKIHEIIGDIEILEIGCMLLIKSPEELAEHSKKIVQNLVPIDQFNVIEFEVGPKQATHETIHQIILDAQVSESPAIIHQFVDSVNRSLTIIILNGQLDLDSIKAIKNVVKKDKFIKTVKLMLNGQSIPLTNLSDEIEENNSLREKIIQNDDVTDLKILLNSNISFEDFLEKA